MKILCRERERERERERWGVRIMRFEFKVH